MDRETCALQCALLTAAASGVRPAISAAEFSTCAAEAQAIRSLEDACPRSDVTACVLRAAPFDWNLPVESSGFDVIVACDVLYEDFSVSPLSTVIPALCGRASRGQRLLLTDPPHRAPENRRRFLEALMENDRELQVQQSKVVTACVDGAPADVQIVLLQRRSGAATVGLPLSSIV